MTTNTHPTCAHCGATNVTWATAKSSARYLANTTGAYDNGARYLRGPHAATCDGGAARTQAARTAARRSMRQAGVRRYIAAYGTPADFNRLLDYVAGA